MDNNPVPAQPMQQPPQAPQAAPPTGNNKIMFMMVTGLVVTILIVGAVYWYLNNQKAKSYDMNSTVKVSQPDTTLQTDLDAIEIPEVDANFTEVDKDLGSL